MSIWKTIAEITPTLFLSSGQAAADKHAVTNKQINCVINATIDLPNPQWTNRIKAVRVPVNDVPHADLRPYFDKVADIIEANAQHGARCLVHCVAGVSRSSSLCIAYLMKYHRMSLREAHAHVRGRRPVIRPNLGFWRQLIEYEYKLRGSKSVAFVHSPLGYVPDVYHHELRNMLPIGPVSRYRR